jgi:hypothetical protein
MHYSVSGIERDPFHVRSFLEGVVTETFLLEQLIVVNEEHVFSFRSNPLIPLFVRFTSLPLLSVAFFEHY